ncbi:Carboxylic ester hydrolase [Fusarium falciforme]|uniref:Carboxylic ester hydrolase n=1 Tax=Fusarium falciforme TaxID=195108 RepID=UPI0023004BDB|nr:Carboxylic ester hydrolase [Fusarium falciforme]WAO85001.1 Carboxylic ester hydrolase [Fusarium falciforme]
MSSSLFHPTLCATLHGVSRGEHVRQFRGLQYGTIPYRFANPEPPAALSGEVDCTDYGPRCPQNHVDFRHLLRIPQDEEIPAQDEDEFRCLNLEVTSPVLKTLPERPYPVLVWIHGGSQAVSFGTNASGLCDPTGLVQKSIDMAEPIIAVTINYRLNMFAFGDCASERNLALRDQQQALEFVKAHISGFGGDPENITIAGESAGAVYCHAHLLMGRPARQCILQSGTLHLSPPQPRGTAEMLIARVANELSRLGNWTLRDAPMSKMLEAQERLGLGSFYLQMEEKLEGWEERIGDHFQRVLIGDTEYESVLWRNGIESLSPEYICDAFDSAGEAAPALKKLYGIISDRPVSCKLGALDLLNDARFSLPIDLFMKQCQQAKKPSFRFLVDQPNPWQTSSRAHHGVDLLYLFNAYDLSHNHPAQEIARSMQEKWIMFIHGQDPWKPGEAFAFGPFGESRLLSPQALNARRRQQHVAALAALGSQKVNEIVARLATGRSSLLN